jgi:DNA-directed RNA polymerase specialized sigma24 family protein
MATQIITDFQPIIPIIPEHYATTIRKISLRMGVTYSLTPEEIEDLQSEMTLVVCRLAAENRQYCQRQVETSIRNAGCRYIRDEVKRLPANTTERRIGEREEFVDPADTSYRPFHLKQWEVRNDLHLLLDHLSPDMRVAVEAYHGIGIEPMSIREIAEYFQVSESSVEWMLQSALRIMRAVGSRR